MIGNPPYVSVKVIDSRFLSYFQANYKTCKGQTDLFALFVEKGIDLMKNSGFFSYIIPDSINDRSNYTVLREILLQKTNLTNILSLNGVFADASVGSTIFITGSYKSNDIELIKSKDLESFTLNNVERIVTSKMRILKNIN